MSTHEIVILGANFGGLSMAHYLLKHTIPALKSLDPTRSYHITQISPSSSAYFKIALPRVIGDPSKIPVESVVLPFLDGFSKYSSEYAFLQGTAVNVDVDFKTVTVQLPESTHSVSYDSLVVSTGYKTNSPLWAVSEELRDTKKEIAKLHDTLPTARSILIAGGGPVGVETAGEIITKYPQKKVTLISGSNRVLPKLNSSTSDRAVASLTNFGIKVVNNLKVSKTVEQGNSTIVHFSDGSHQTYDIYIDATGGKPATDFLPLSWLTSSGHIEVDPETIRVVSSPDAYAVGDAASPSCGTAMDMDAMIRPAASSLGRDIASSLKADDAKEKMNKLAALKQRKFKSNPNSQVVPIGHNGVGQAFGWRLPSKLVWFAKGKSYLLSMAKPLVTGENVAKA